MSWGYFLDLELTVPTREWKRLLAVEGAALPAGWWGFRADDLEARFGGASFFDRVTFKKALTFFKEGRSARKSIEEADGHTTVRVTTLLDRSGDTLVAKPVAAAFDAAAKVGGSGHVQLVNDGSYSGEAGVSVTIEGGALVRARLADVGALRERLSVTVYPEMAQYFSPEREASTARDETSAKKPTETKPTEKKPAAKKPAEKKSR